MINEAMFDLYDPGELIGPAFHAGGPDFFRHNDLVEVASGRHQGRVGVVVRVGSGPHRQGPLDYVWYEVVLQSGVHLYVSGWGWLRAVPH